MFDLGGYYTFNLNQDWWMRASVGRALICRTAQFVRQVQLGTQGTVPLYAIPELHNCIASGMLHY